MWFEASSEYWRERPDSYHFFYMYKWYYLSINFTHSKCVIKTHMPETWLSDSFEYFGGDSSLFLYSNVLSLILFQIRFVYFLFYTLKTSYLLPVDNEYHLYSSIVCRFTCTRSNKQKNHSIGCISSNLMMTLIRLDHWNVNNSILLRVRG